MVSSALFVCTGNICRSPVAAFAMKDALPSLEVSSAGLHAMVGHRVDEDSAKAARQLGVSVSEHRARQFTSEIGGEADLILVMSANHLNEIRGRWPHLSGKTMLLGQFADGKEVPDPYRMGFAMHLRAVELICECTEQWASRLEPAGK